LVTVLSGKGGVGKTNLVVNLAVAARGFGARVLVVDGDLGLANVDVLLGLVPPYTIADLLEERCSLQEALVKGPRGVEILPAAAGRSDMAALPVADMERLSAKLREAAASFDLVLIDAGAGVGPSVIGLTAICCRAIIVTTSEPVSMADAYATFKILRRNEMKAPVDLVVNSVRDELDARSTHTRLNRMARRFLDSNIGYLGFLPHDPRLAEAVARQRAVVELFPSAPSSRRLVALAQGLLRVRSSVPPVAAPFLGSPFDRNAEIGGDGCTRN
jgi:flagellar biosynthesis protein FlhG